MTMLEIYKSRKQALTQRIKESKSLYETGSVISEAFETMQYQYISHCTDESLKNKVCDLIGFAKANFPVIESIDKYKLWDNARDEEKKKKSLLPGFIMLLVGIVMIFMPLGYYMFIKNLKFADMQTYLMIMAAGCFVMLIAGFMLFFRKKQKSKTTVEIYADRDDLTNRLEEVVKKIDILVEKEKGYISAQQKLMDRAINEEELQMFSYLLEAKLSGEGDFALEQLAEVEHYLAKQDVIILNYSKGNEKYFDFLTGEETKTIRPALIRGGRVLKNGLAQISE